MNKIEQFIEDSELKAELRVMPPTKFNIVWNLFVLCSRLFEKRNSVLRSADEMELNDTAGGDSDAFETWQNLIHDVNFKKYVKDGWMVLHKIQDNKYKTDLSLFEIEKAINLTYSGIQLFNKRYEILQKRRKIKEIRQSAQIYEI